jgi:Flp pilus assembly protein TadD
VWPSVLLGLALAGGLAAAGCGQPVSPPRTTTTFTKDVAPILYTHCAPCHRPGQPVPFTLQTYAEVKSRASVIVRAVGERRMPPWLPAPGQPAFIGERRLQSGEIATIRRWVESGTPEGNPADLPAAPSWRSGWDLGEPDIVVTMPKSFIVEPGSHDVYRNVVMPVTLSGRRFVRAIEFRPGGAPVHHAVIRIDRSQVSRRLDGLDGQPGFDGMAAYDVQDPDGHFLGWAPGRGPIEAPDGLPWRLDQGSDLVVELHLMPGPTRATVQPSIGLHFTETPPRATPVMIVMGSKSIDIPPGERAYQVRDSYRLPVDADLLSVYPHAHYLGRQMTVQARLPDGGIQRILHIERWSFQWQQDYRLVTPLRLPRGTTIEMLYAYDNSADNPQNPHRPPRRVTWGPQSTDEMANVGLQLLSHTPQEAAALTRSFAEHAARIDVAGAEMLVRIHPQDAAHAVLLGTGYVRVGRFADAIPALERALRLDPRSASAENHLGGALLAVGRSKEAVEHFRRAADLAPRDEHLRFNVGKVLADMDSPGAAEREYRRALSLNGDFAEAHHELGTLLFATGRLAEAVIHLERAVALMPESADALSNLGGALAQSGRQAEAVRRIRQALEIDPSHAAARQNLSRLQASPPPSLP